MAPRGGLEAPPRAAAGKAGPLDSTWNAILQRHLAAIPAGARVVDLHAGAREHALALARRGCAVTWLVPSAVAAAAEGSTAAETDIPSAVDLRERAAAEGVAATVVEGDFRRHELPDPAQAVLALGVLSAVPRPAAASLLHRLRAWTGPGSLVALTALHVDAPEYAEAQNWRRIGLHSFRSPTGRYRTFLARGEILDLMLGWTILHHRETPDGRAAGREAGAGPGGPDERPGLVELVAKRPADLA